jgi:glutaredoxin
VKVTLYTKQDCGLCEEVEALLRRLQRKNHFDLEYVDIETDDAAHALYWLRIPVVTVDGAEVASAPIDQKQLEAALTV